MDRRPTEFELAIDGSVLRQPLARWIALAGMIVVLVLALLQLLPLADYGRPVAAVVAGALGIGLLICVIPLLFIRWVDRREPEPWFMVIAAFLWGAVVAAAVTAFAVDRTGLAASTVGQLLAQPVIAETAKGLGLLGILLLLRDEFNGVRDGFVYGALIGLGFSWFAAAQGIGSTFARTGDPNWAFEFLTRFPLLGLTGDTLFTAVLGTAVGVAMQQHDRLRAAPIVLGGYLLAVLAHVLFDWLGPLLTGQLADLAGATLGDRSEVLPSLAGAPLWIGWLGTALAALVLGAPFIVLIVLGLRRTAAIEHRMLLDRLADEDEDIITAAERARLEATAEPPRGAGRRIAQLQNELATRKAWLALRALDVEGDRHVAAYRDELRAMR